MSIEHANDWAKFESETLDLLRIYLPTESGLDLAERLFQIVIAPSFQPVVCWNFCLSRSRSAEIRYLALLTRWRRDVDVEKFGVTEWLSHRGDLQPTIETQVIEASTVFMEIILQRLQSERVLAYAKSSMIGVDGTNYELAIGSGFSHVRYYWWGEAPAGWETLGQTVAEVLEYLSPYVHPIESRRAV